MITRTEALLLIAIVAVVGCGPRDRGEDTASTDSIAAAAPTADEHGADDSAHEALALRPIMQQLGRDMTTLTMALWIEDYASVTSSASAIANHPHISAEEVERIEGILGAETAAFDSLDAAVHEAAVRLHESARSRDPQAIVQALGEVQRGCVACHSQFRERLRTIP